MSTLYRSHHSAKNRRNYVDDALENLENETAQLKENIQLMRQEHATAEKRIELLEEDNTQLRKILDQVRYHRNNRLEQLVSNHGWIPRSYLPVSV